jgi:MOSC domain-containing protein YiiM
MRDKIRGLYRGKPQKLIDFYGNEYISGIEKERVNSITVCHHKIDGDDVANHNFHGGKERVICVYSYKHYLYWQNEYNRTLPECAFGENMTLEQMTEEEVYVGDIFQIGEVIVQVSQGRFPCMTIERRTGFKHLLKRVIDTGYTGYFFRILQEGTINVGDTVQLIERKQNMLSIMDLHHLYYHGKGDHEKIQAAIQMEDLADFWKMKLAKSLNH